MIDLRENLPTRLRDAREAANLTQSELAERLGVSMRSVQGWESGVRPQPRHRRLIAAFLVEVEGAAAA